MNGIKVSSRITSIDRTTKNQNKERGRESAIDRYLSIRVDIDRVNRYGI